MWRMKLITVVFMKHTSIYYVKLVYLVGIITTSILNACFVANLIIKLLLIFSRPTGLFIRHYITSSSHWIRVGLESINHK